MQVTVAQANGSTDEYEVEESTTILQLKQLHSAQTGIDVALQRFHLGHGNWENNELLSEDATLKDSGITNGTTVNMRFDVHDDLKMEGGDETDSEGDETGSEGEM